MRRHYLRQCRNLVNWTLRNMKWSFDRNSYILILRLKLSFGKWRPFCLSLNVLGLVYFYGRISNMQLATTTEAFQFFISITLLQYTIYATRHKFRSLENFLIHNVRFGFSSVFALYTKHYCDAAWPPNEVPIIGSFDVLFVINLNKFLTHWGRCKMASISQTTFSNAFSWMKIYEFRLRFY